MDGYRRVLSGVCKFVATPGNVANSMVINLSRYPREPGGLMDLTPRLTGIIQQKRFNQRCSLKIRSLVSTTNHRRSLKYRLRDEQHWRGIDLKKLEEIEFRAELFLKRPLTVPPRYPKQNIEQLNRSNEASKEASNLNFGLLRPSINFHF